MKTPTTLALSLILVACANTPKSSNTSSSDGCNPYPYSEAIQRGGNLKSAPVDTSKPNLLIIGDSISEGYTPFVKAKLNEYDVVRVGETTCTPINAQGTRFTLDNLDHWIAENPNLDVITWNNGAWDSTPSGQVIWGREHHTDQAEYEVNLIKIARKLKATGARVLFFYTTEIKVNFSPTFELGRDTLMNASAKALLISEGVEVYDLHSVSVGIDNLRIAPDNFHFTEAGSEILANYVTGAVRGNEVQE